MTLNDRTLQDELNKEHALRPQEGDFWHERFMPYFIVVEVDEPGVWVLDKTIDVDDSHYRFDEKQRAYMTLEQLWDAVTYSTMRDKFCARVRPRKGKEPELDVWGVC
jgi:hypothetical protein